MNKPNQESIMEFMASKLGGKKQVYRDYIKVNLLNGVSISELIAEAICEEWLDEFNAALAESVLGPKNQHSNKKGYWAEVLDGKTRQCWLHEFKSVNRGHRVPKQFRALCEFLGCTTVAANAKWSLMSKTLTK